MPLCMAGPGSPGVCLPRPQPLQGQDGVSQAASGCQRVLWVGVESPELGRPKFRSPVPGPLRDPGQELSLDLGFCL